MGSRKLLRPTLVGLCGEPRVTFVGVEHTRFNMFNMSMGQHVDKSTMVIMGSSIMSVVRGDYRILVYMSFIEFKWDVGQRLFF